MKQIYIDCRNSLNRKHRWHNAIGKNVKKPKSCIYCNKLEADLIIKKPLDLN